VSRRPLPLSGVTFSIVGSGKVGASLAAWAVARGAEPIAIGERRESESSRELAGRLDCVTLPLGRLASAGQDLLLIAVPDPALDEAVGTLARKPQAEVALHTSGCRDAGALAPLAHRGTAVGSLHPLKAFPRPLFDPSLAKGILFGIDGDPAALEMARRLARAWGARTAEIPPESRLVYHFAATLAAGGVVTLLAAAAELAERSGMPRSVLDGYFELARGALQQAAQASDPAAAVTGPVARGDRQTVLEELEAVRQVAPEMVPMIVALSRESLRQCARTPGGRRAEPPPRSEALAEELDRQLGSLAGTSRGAS
jgi:predicted short-subunit dehydrogenase-like oxidoreductase (DUF2520 family)